MATNEIQNDAGSNRALPLYARLSMQAGAAEWLNAALEQEWIAAESPAVFVSYCTRDEKWRYELDRFLSVELSALRCPDSDESYRSWSFASLKEGTATGSQYPLALSAQLWRCRAAIVILSQDYLNSTICSSIELPILAWRHATQGMPLYVLQVGVVSSSAAMVALPKVRGVWPDLDLSKQTSDLFPGLDHRDRKLAKQPHLFELRKKSDRERRLAAFAELVRSNLAAGHAAPPQPSTHGTASPQSPRAKALPHASVGAFPPLDGFEGRRVERELLVEALTHAGTGVVSLCQIGGAGKTCLALKAIEDVLHRVPGRFEAVFRFTFYGGRSQSEFEQELLRFVCDALQETRPIEGQQDWLLDVLWRRAVLLLLDGMEVIQSSSLNADAGLVHQGGARKLLLWLCNKTGGCSTALVTSRIDLRDLLPFRGGRYRPVDLPGLSSDDGTRLLGRLGVHASEEVLREIVAELAGHPLALMVFANGAQRVKASRTPAAVAVMRKVRLSDPGNLEAKLGRLLDYYRQAIDDVDRRLITAVTVFPDGSSAPWLCEMLADQVVGHHRQVAAQLGARLGRLARDGILQAVPTLSGTEYTAHPVIREAFRIPESGFAEKAVRLHLAARPEMFQPRTGEQARPCVKAIEIYCEHGNFAAAAGVLEGQLNGGSVLAALDEWRLLFHALWQFVQPERREACRTALDSSRFADLLDWAIVSCISLLEWEIAEELCRFAATVLGPHRLAVLSAEISLGVGSVADAEADLHSALANASALESITLQAKLADILRERGQQRQAWDVICGWIQGRPRDLEELREWMSLWWDVARCATRLWSRSAPPIARRFLAVMQALSPPYVASEVGAFLEWQGLQCVPEGTRSADQWLRMLELARLLGDSAASNSSKDGGRGWMVGVLTSLNGLRRHQDALDNVPIVLSQLNERSQFRAWVDVEVSKAHLGLGQVHLAREAATRALQQALSAQRRNTALMAAEILVDLPAEPLAKAHDKLAREVIALEQAERLRADEGQLDAPCPGEAGWQEHVTELLMACAAQSRLETARAEQTTGSRSPETGDAALELGPPAVDAQASSQAEFDETLRAALRIAAQCGIAEAVPVLLARGGRESGGDDVDDSPLMLAVKGGKADVVRALVAGLGPIDLAESMQSKIGLAVVNAGNVDIAETVLSGAINISPSWLTDALMNVSRRGDERMLELLLRRGADPSAVDGSGQLPIVKAVKHGNVAILLRLARLVSVSVAQADGTTALAAAVSHDRDHIIDLLADLGVRAGAGNEGMSLLSEAAESGALTCLVRLARRFDLSMDRERHLLPGIRNAARLDRDAQLRFLLEWLEGEVGGRLNKPDLRPKIRAALKRIAVKAKLKPSDPEMQARGMNIGLVVNARGKLCLVHDRPFGATPLWVGYHVDRRRLEVILDDGSTYPIGWQATDDMHKYMLLVDKILIIRMEDRKPVEGFDTSLTRLKNGKTIN